MPEYTHTHYAPQDGSGERSLPDGSTRADDECDCGQLLCPDTGKPVAYDHDGMGPGPSYWHLDGSTCFLHQTSVPEGFQP